MALLAVVAMATIGLAAWVIVLGLKGPDLSAFDVPVTPPMSGERPASAEHAAVVASLGREFVSLKRVAPAERLAILRTKMDDWFSDRQHDARVIAVTAGDVAGEWVIARGASSARRLLYLHGGAFMMGSPRSHRTITTRLSEVAGAAVLALDYRLMPEHSRWAGIEDCRAAYRWMLAHGPEGEGPAQAVFVAGDSAGGSLTLSLIAWVRDSGLRAPDAAVAMSPLTDATLGSPSLRTNIATDPMLGPLFGALSRVPRTVLLAGAWWQTRILPRNPVVSPVYGDLSGLGPVLVQASEHEMLRDDARRYVNRARAAGSPVRLQTWAHMVHVWQIFQPELPEAREAFDEIARFLADPWGSLRDGV